MFAQIVRIDGLAMLEGCGPVAFQPLEKPGIINLRKTIRGRSIPGFRSCCAGNSGWADTMDEIARTRKPIIITKRGKPVAKLVPAEPAPRKPLFGCMAGTVTF